MGHAGSPDNGDRAGLMGNMHAGQVNYDSRVAAEANNAEAWCVRGMYYNNYYGRYEEAATERSNWTRNTDWPGL